MEHDGRVFVLLDPNSYLTDPNCMLHHPRGTAAIRNLVALGAEGDILWEAELPQLADYYYSLLSVAPLTVNSFSSYRCEIDPGSGKIVRKVFFK
jgi:hypothetical protein